MKWPRRRQCFCQTQLWTRARACSGAGCPLFRSLPFMLPLADYAKAPPANEFLELRFDGSTSECLDTTPSKPFFREAYEPRDRFGVGIADELDETARLTKANSVSDVMNHRAPTRALPAGG